QPPVNHKLLKSLNSIFGRALTKSTPFNCLTESSVFRRDLTQYRPSNALCTLPDFGHPLS
ncbi:hypothetical protein, partial [Sphingomonas sp. GC_Shp_6]|uniref:hypothetical protein n=1 Tax=Sphingomonas sp. GC_Shp_6 TaxID=2937378 RepID=UPI00226A90B4